MNEAPFGLIMIDGRRPLVAVVGGSGASALVAARLIEVFGCTPEEAATAGAALALLRCGRTFDLILCDLAIPDMDAIVAVQLMRLLDRRGVMPIIALVGETEVTDGRVRAAGFAASVRKPYSPRELLAAMKGALGRSAILHHAS